MGVKNKSKQDNSKDEIPEPSVRTAERGVNAAATILPTRRRRPNFDASERGPCCAVRSYDACVRLCIKSWIEDHPEEALYFLKGDCSKLREAFDLKQVLLQSEEELLKKQSFKLVGEDAPKSKKCVGKLEVRVDKIKMSLRSSSTAYEETYDCSLKLRSSYEKVVISIQPGSSQTHVFLNVDRCDDLIVKVHNSKEEYCGEAQARVDNSSKKLQLYRKPENKHVGDIQLLINYSTSQEENNVKCGSIIAETVAYDFLLEAAMKAQQFGQKKLLLRGPWKWLENKFVSYYGVSDAYAKLRYLSYVMQVATPTKDCLTKIYDFLSPVVKNKHKLSYQEKRMLGEIEDQLQQILTKIFKNYKSLDESSPSGMMDDFRAATGSPPPALLPAVKLYCLLHDVKSPEAKVKFCGYFQAAAQTRSKRHLAKMDEGASISRCRELVSLISIIKEEIRTDREIKRQGILPSFIDLPNLSAPIYSMDLSSILKAFLVGPPPPGPSPPVIELVIATADFQKKLSSWKIKSVNERVNAKVLFHSLLTCWIEEKRLSLLDKVKCSGIRTQQTTASFIEEMYDQLMKTLDEYEKIVSRWPEFRIILEKAIADVEIAISEALKGQYADVLDPLKDSPAPNKWGKFVQKFSDGTAGTYIVPDKLGALLNSMERILYVFHSDIESRFKSCSGKATAGERLNEISAMLSADLRNYIEAIGEKLAENTRVQSEKILKKVIEDSKEFVIKSDVRSRMQPLENVLKKTIKNLHSVFDTRVFISVCRSFWDWMGQVVLHFLKNRKVEVSGYKGLEIAISILDEIFKSQMQKLLVGALKEKDLDPPESVMEVHSQLAKKS